MTFRTLTIAVLLGALPLATANAQVNFGYHNFRVRVPIHNYHARANEAQCKWKNTYVYGRLTRQWACRDDDGNWYLPNGPDAADDASRYPVHNYHASSEGIPNAYPSHDSRHETRDAIVTPTPRTALDRTLDDIVTQDSHSWGFFRYDRGSMHDASVVSKSKDGGTVEIHGTYTYNSGSHGWVKVKLINGQVNCLEFWNEGRCRALGNSPTVQALKGFGKELVEAMKNPSPAYSGGNGNNEAQREYERQQLQNDILANHEIQQSMGNH